MVVVLFLFTYHHSFFFLAIPVGRLTDKQQNLSIYSSTGALIYRAYGDCEYTFDEKGVYLVQIGKEALKVLR